MTQPNQNPTDNAGGQPAPSPSAPADNGAAIEIDPAVREQLLAEGRKQGRNATFAELRKKDALKKSFLQYEGVKPEQTEASDASKASINYRPLDRAIGRSGRQLSEQAYARIERDFASERPEDADAWLADYFGGLGAAQVARAQTAPSTATDGAQSAPQKSTTPPVSDRGGPPPAKTSLEDANPLTMTASDLNALKAQLGPAKFNAWVLAKTSNIRITAGR